MLQRLPGSPFWAALVKLQDSIIADMQKRVFEKPEEALRYVNMAMGAMELKEELESTALIQQRNSRIQLTDGRVHIPLRNRDAAVTGQPLNCEGVRAFLA